MAVSRQLVTPGRLCWHSQTTQRGARRLGAKRWRASWTRAPVLDFTTVRGNVSMVRGLDTSSLLPVGFLLNIEGAGPKISLFYIGVFQVNAGKRRPN